MFKYCLLPKNISRQEQTASQTLVENAQQKNNFLIFHPKYNYVVGTQKNILNETVLLSTQNIC